MNGTKLNKYEMVVVTKADAGHEAQRKLYERITSEMEKAGAHHIRFELWGKRRLAYPIDKVTKGIYMYFVYLANGEFPKTIQRMLKMSSIVLRYMTIKLASGIDPNAYDFEKERQFDELPTEADDYEHIRPMTGWELEFGPPKERIEDDEDLEDEDMEDEDLEEEEEEEEYDEEDEEEDEQ